MEKISKTKNEDLQTYLDLLAILEVAVRMYVKTENSEYVERITELDTLTKTYEEKIKTGEYTEADERRDRVDRELKKLYGNKNIRN